MPPGPRGPDAAGFHTYRFRQWVRRRHSRVGASAFPAAHVVENHANLGFAEGSNVGLRIALAAGARYVVLLNPDTVVEPQWLEELVRSAEVDDTIGVCQSKIYRYPASSPPVINTVGNRLHYTGVGWCGHLDEVDRGQFADDVEIPYASGAAMLVKSDVVRDIGLLDADLFMYHDDLDWSLRARLRGHRIVLRREIGCLPPLRVSPQSGQVLLDREKPADLAL